MRRLLLIAVGGALAAVAAFPGISASQTTPLAETGYSCLLDTTLVAGEAWVNCTRTGPINLATQTSVFFNVTGGSSTNGCRGRIYHPSESGPLINFDLKDVTTNVKSGCHYMLATLATNPIHLRSMQCKSAVTAPAMPTVSARFDTDWGACAD